MQDTSIDKIAVREAQQFLMGWDGSGRRPVPKVTLKTDVLPNSVAYLHSLIARGLGDSYNYHDGTFIVRIALADQWRFETLKGVTCVALTYRDPPPLERDI